MPKNKMTDKLFSDAAFIKAFDLTIKYRTQKEELIKANYSFKQIDQLLFNEVTEIKNQYNLLI